jgi:hypothetical protein
MTPFEALMRELGLIMDITLHPDAHQSCSIFFPQDDLRIQMDLNSDADQILVGTQLGRINPGPYRERIFLQALRVNGSSQTPRGILAFSEKNDTLVLFQFLTLAKLSGERLHHFLQLFREHAKIWKQALTAGEIPIMEEDARTGNTMFGLRL